MKKKLLSLALLGMTMGLVGCGDKKEYEKVDLSEVFGNTTETEAVASVQEEITTQEETSVETIQSVLENAQVGDVISMGIYTDENGYATSELTWDVVAREDGRLLIATHGPLLNTHLLYDEDLQKASNWEISDVRVFLNGYFYESTFNDEEKSHIMTVTLENNSPISYYETYCPDYNYHDVDSNPCGPTEDKVFLFSYDEIEKYFGPAEVIVYNGGNTGYYYPRATIYDGVGEAYWLRSIGSDSEPLYMADGTQISGGYANENYEDIRPVMWVSY